MLELFRLPWKKSFIDDLDVLETNLEKVFQPVEPSQDFVRELRRGLVNIPVLISPTPNSKVPLYIAFTIASLLSGVAVIGIVIWIIMTLAGRLHTHDKNLATTPQLA